MSKNAHLRPYPDQKSPALIGHGWSERNPGVAGLQKEEAGSPSQTLVIDSLGDVLGIKHRHDRLPSRVPDLANQVPHHVLKLSLALHHG